MKKRRLNYWFQSIYSPEYASDENAFEHSKWKKYKEKIKQI